MGSFAFARRYSRNRCFFLFLRVLRCFSSPGALLMNYGFIHGCRNITPDGFPHSEIHGSMPACGSPWLFAAYHVFLRRPVPWHPPCALSNLIVTILSSCQRIDFSIFDCFFLLRPTAKLFAFLRSCVISNTFATGFFTRCFSIWLCSFQSTFSSRFYSIPENDTGSRR